MLYLAGNLASITAANVAAPEVAGFKKLNATGLSLNLLGVVRDVRKANNVLYLRVFAHLHLINNM